MALVWIAGGFDKEPPKKIDSQIQTDLVIYKVSRSQLTSSFSLTGNVTGDKLSYIKTFDYLFDSKEDFLLSIELGENINKGEKFGIFCGSALISSVNGMLIDICEEQKENGTYFTKLHFLDYDSLYIEAKIDEEYYSRINYDSPVFVYKNNISFQTSINRIGFEISNGKIPLVIDLPNNYNMLPGAEMNLIIIAAYPRECLWIEEDFVFWDGNSYYVYILENELSDQYHQVSVTIGEKVEIIDEYGNSRIMYEITTGLSEGDYIVFETVMK